MIFICNPLKVATPPTAVAVSVPCSEPVPVEVTARATVISPVASVPEVTMFPYGSRIWIFGCGLKLTPATTEASGWVLMASLEAVA